MCYSSKEALVCHHIDGSNLNIKRRFCRMVAIKSIMHNLSIKKVVIFTKSAEKTTIIVLLSDDSLYIYELLTLKHTDILESINLIKHIYPIERRDKTTFISNMPAEKTPIQVRFRIIKTYFRYFVRNHP